MELDIAKKFGEMLKESFSNGMDKFEDKFNNDIEVLESLKISFCFIDKEVNLNLGVEIKDYISEKEKKMKSFNSSGAFEANRRTKEVNNDDTRDFKTKKIDTRSKTALSRNTTQTNVNVNLTEKGKSIKPITDRFKKVNMTTIEDSRTDNYKTENTKKKYSGNLYKEPMGVEKKPPKLVKNSSVERIREERKKDITINKIKKESIVIKKPSNLNKTTIVSKKNLNISTDIKHNTTITKDTPITKNEINKVKVSEKNLTPIKKKDSTIIIHDINEGLKNNCNNKSKATDNDNQTQKTDKVIENIVKSETDEQGVHNSDKSPINVSLSEQIKPKRISLYLISRSNLEDTSICNNSRALRLYTISGFCNTKQAILLNLFDKNVVNVLTNTRNLIINNYYNLLNKEVLYIYPMIRPYFEDSSLNDLLNRPFAPSKTAINGLNFVTTIEEQNLLKKEQPIEIINVFKLIYVLMNESLENIEENKIIENLLNTVLPRIKVDSLKPLLLSMVKIMSFSERQIEHMEKLFKEYPKILNSPDLLKLNKSVSFMSFLIKEIYDYSVLRSTDGTLLVKVRTLIAEYNRKKERLEKIKNLLK